MHIRVFTAFSGYDSQCLALDRIHCDFPDFTYEFVGWSEIDKFAIQAHNILYPDAVNLNFGDISKIDWSNVPDFDLFTYSFPCQDISIAGLQRGFAEGSDTRSGLLWECQKAIKAKHPKFLLMENVKALVQKKFLPEFNRWQKWLFEQGYSNFWKVLNAKDYGVPQNRERVFMVSILRGEQELLQYEFPKPFTLERRLKHILEPYGTVPEEYYLKPKQVQEIVMHCKRNKRKVAVFKTNFVDGSKTSGMITAKYGSRQTDTYIKERPALFDDEGFSVASTEQVLVEAEPALPQLIIIGNARPKKRESNIPLSTRTRIYDPDGIAPTLTATDYKDPKLIIEYEAPTVTTSHEPKIIEEVVGYRIRKLTEREVFRLMDLNDNDIDKILNAKGNKGKRLISKSQCYKLAGNSIVVSCLYHIFRKLFVDTTQNQPIQQSLFN